MNRIGPAHLIADISYSQDRLVCTCGVKMRANGLELEWNAHRVAEGQKLRSLGASPRRTLPRQNWTLGRRS